MRPKAGSSLNRRTKDVQWFLPSCFEVLDMRFKVLYPKSNQDIQLLLQTGKVHCPTSKQDPCIFCQVKNAWQVLFLEMVTPFLRVKFSNLLIVCCNSVSYLLLLIIYTADSVFEIVDSFSCSREGCGGEGACLRKVHLEGNGFPAAIF